MTCVDRLPALGQKLKPVLIPPAINRIMVGGADHLEAVEVLRDIIRRALGRARDLRIGGD
ncbi:hypothetical protein RTM1035_11380 [Roseovarius sp. TM1035]|nr:Hypothetical protein RAK1035_3620 [Roseovarius sp. AK1035]EDM30607.1 hypothetical protein RTM1035_11380 [Roseovarius sp. TM1035]